MANLPKRDIIFNEFITGVDAKPHFENWWNFSSQLLSASSRQTLTIVDGVIKPIVADNFINGLPDVPNDLIYIMDDTMQDGAILRLWAVDDAIDITVKHGTNDSAISLLGGIDRKLSCDCYLELKHEGSKWVETSSVLGASNLTAGVARIATQEEVASGSTGGGGVLS